MAYSFIFIPLFECAEKLKFEFKKTRAPGLAPCKAANATEPGGSLSKDILVCFFLLLFDVFIQIKRGVFYAFVSISTVYSCGFSYSTHPTSICSV